MNNHNPKTYRHKSKADTEQYVRANQAKYKKKGAGGFALKTQELFDRHIVAPITHAVGGKLINATKRGGAVFVTGKDRTYKVVTAKKNVTTKRAFKATPQQVKLALAVASKRVNLAAKRKGKKPNQGVNMGVVFPMVSKGNRSFTKVNITNDEMILHSRAMVGTIKVAGNDQPGKKLLDVLVNPMNVVMCGPREVRMASTFDKSDITFLSFEVVSTRSTSTNGSMHGAHFFDPTEYIPENEDGLRTLTNKVGAHDTTFYNTGNKSMMTWVRPKWPGKKPTFYVDRTGTSEASLRQTDEGRFIIMLGVGYDGDGSEDTITVMGTVWCNMTVRFYDPTLQIITGSNDLFSIPCTDQDYKMTVQPASIFAFGNPISFHESPTGDIIKGANNNAGCEPIALDEVDPLSGAIYLPVGVWSLYGGMGTSCSISAGSSRFNWQIYFDGQWHDMDTAIRAGVVGQPISYGVYMSAVTTYTMPMPLPAARIIARPAVDTYVRLAVDTDQLVGVTLTIKNTVVGMEDSFGVIIQAVEPNGYERSQLIPTTAISDQFDLIRKQIQELKDVRNFVLRCDGKEDKTDPPPRRHFVESFKEGKRELVEIDRRFDFNSLHSTNDGDEEKSDGESVDDNIQPLRRKRRTVALTSGERAIGPANPTGGYVRLTSKDLQGVISTPSAAIPPNKSASLK